jgi:hypothetical protein
MLYDVVLRTPYARGQLQGIGSLVSAKNVESGIGRDVARKGTKKRKKAKARSWIKGCNDRFHNSNWFPTTLDKFTPALDWEHHGGLPGRSQL